MCRTASRFGYHTVDIFERVHPSFYSHGDLLPEIKIVGSYPMLPPVMTLKYRSPVDRDLA